MDNNIDNHTFNGNNIDDDSDSLNLMIQMVYIIYKTEYDIIRCDTNIYRNK